VGTTELKPW